MAVKQLAEDLWIVPGLVNVYLLDTDDGLAVLDTGFPRSAPKILDAVREIGRQPSDVHHILLSHCHPDHIGSAAILKRETGALVWAHPIDATRMEAGKTMRENMQPSVGLRNHIMTALLRRRVTTVEPVTVDRLLEDGESPSFAPDLTAVHVPGHSAGMIAFLWKRRGGVLFPGDTFVNQKVLRLPLATEDPVLALASVAKLAELEFDMICVMHGPPVLTGGAERLRLRKHETVTNGRN